jgi:hypothetical protein
MRKPRTLSIGSVSHGTLRPEDLAPAFLSAAEDLPLSRADRAKVNSWRSEIDDLLAVDEDSNECTPETAGENLNEIANELADLLGNYVPDLMYFGSRPGDGADFGVWLSEDWDREDVTKIDAGDPRPSVASVTTDYLAEVTDHGNVTLYRKDGRRWVECWAVV